MTTDASHDGTSLDRGFGGDQGIGGDQDPRADGRFGVRSDEFLLTTPQVVGNDRRGLPTQPWIGLTRTFLPATSMDVPTWHWTTLFKPRLWAFFVLPTDRAFAWWWWYSPLIGFLGVHALLCLIGGRPLVAGALAAALTLSPYTAWWSLAPALIAGTLAAAAACAVAGLRVRRRRSAVVLGLLAGWWAVGGALILYPPWQLSTALLLVAVVIGVAVDHRVNWRRVAEVALPAGMVVVPALALWASQARWNDYAKYTWRAEPGLTRPVIESGIGTQLVLRIDPCADSTRVSASPSRSPRPR